MKTKILSALIGLGCFIQPLFAQDAATNTAPVIPEAARKHFVMGTALFKDAKTAEDYAQVTGEFKQAAELAPQWPEARYNLALSKEAAGDYSGAMADLKRYQVFKLSESEARTVQDKIYVVEAKLAKAEKKKAEEQNAVDTEKSKRENLINSFLGSWKPLGSTRPGNSIKIGRIDDEKVFIDFWAYGHKQNVYDIEIKNGALNFSYLLDGDECKLRFLPTEDGKLKGFSSVLDYKGAGSVFERESN